MPPPRPNSRRVLGLIVCAASLGVSCSGDDDGATEAPSTTDGETSGRAEALPPTGFEELEEIFQPLYEPLGMRVTRSSMVELDAGPHLQLYVEPIGAFTAQQYLDAIVPTTAAVVPFIFDEWAGLGSFDVCQEPPPGVDDSVAPEQVTVVALTRDQAESIDWPSPQLVDMMRAVDGATLGEVRGNDEVEALPAFQAARADAD